MAISARGGFEPNSRLLVLKTESPGHQALESILRLLWEMDQWQEKRVKNKMAGE